MRDLPAARRLQSTVEVQIKLVNAFSALITRDREAKYSGLSIQTCDGVVRGIQRRALAGDIAAYRDVLPRIRNLATLSLIHYF